MFEIKKVIKRFGGVRAVGPLDLVVDPGRTTVLIGPSGCGKSTLLRLMNGLVTADEGAVLFNGKRLEARTAGSVRQRMGYVIQDGGLFPHLTARGNVTLMARYLGWAPARLDARLTELCALTRFPDDGLERYPAQLSGGQNQRVSLMRALMLDPDVLLMDEPLGALDPMIRFELQADLRDIFRQLRKTVVLVTHDLGEAGYLGDRVVLMKDGAIVQDGTIRDIVGQPIDAFAARFVRAQRAISADTGRVE